MKAIPHTVNRNPARISTPSLSKLMLTGATIIASSAIASAAVVNVPGNTRPEGDPPEDDYSLDLIVGAGNSGLLQGDFWIHWNSNKSNFSVPVDTNGHTLHLDTGAGNPDHVGAGAISGSGSVIITNGPHNRGGWQVNYTITGTTANTYTGTTLIAQGQVLLSKTAGVDALLGDITMGDGGNPARVIWGANDQVNDFASFTLNVPTVTGGEAPDAELSFLDLAGFSDTIGSLTLGDDGTKTQIRTGDLDGGVLTVSSLMVNGQMMDAGIYDSSNSTFVFGAGSVVVTAIPEPSSLLLGALGLLALLRRRR